MKFSKYSSTFFKTVTALAFVFYVMATCSSVSAKGNDLLEGINSSESRFIRQITNSEFALDSNLWAIGSDISQVYFRAGTSCLPQRQCYVNKLVITGTGADGRVGTWTSPSLNSITQVPNNQYTNSWWWRPDREIKLDMYFNGYTRRICRVSMNRPWSGFPSRVYIEYTGNNNCRIY